MGEHRIIIVNADARHVLEENVGSIADAKAEARHISADNPDMDIVIQKQGHGGEWEDAWLVQNGWLQRTPPPSGV